jgi:hypothetical protein
MKHIRIVWLAAFMLAGVVSLHAVERMQVDRTRATATTATLNLSKPLAPATELLVFRNGVLQSLDEDYTRAGQAITFTDAVNNGDLIVFVYFTPVT